MQYVQSRLISIINRKDGIRMQTTKVHCPLHVNYLLDFGSYNNVHGGPCESNHKENIKKHAKNTQRHKATLNKWIAQRQVDQIVLSHGNALVDDANRQLHPDPPQT